MDKVKVHLDDCDQKGNEDLAILVQDLWEYYQFRRAVVSCENTDGCDEVFGEFNFYLFGFFFF